MIFQGEHLLPGLIGKAALILAVFFSFAAVVTYLIYYFKKEKNTHILRFSRLLYGSHFILILTACSLLFYILFKHYFEYNYVWKHSSLETPVAYIISCFWAGQEGSFLIWILIQGFLGFFIIKRQHAFEPIAIAVIAFIQLLLLTNLLGINLFGYQMGNSPFFLLREVMTEPLFKTPDYLSFISDGNGLNPLLQNPWMVSHPPLIFAGYALAVIPYALIIAALVNKKYDELLKPLIFWTVTSLLFLGIGIIIGGAWAYEALTFGGFWSWDPVENASLLPWIVLLAALHFLFIVKRKNFLLIPALLFSTFGYILVVYASFLTRSGILANTSAHSFGNDGFQYQIIVLVLATILVPVFLLILRRKELYRKDTSTFFSTEFMMYVGSILLLLSAFQIIFTTSIPVINSIFSIQLTSPNNRIAFYNSWQLPITAAICLVLVVSQILSNKKLLIKNLYLPFILTLIISLIIKYFLQSTNFKQNALIFTTLLCILYSLDFLIRFWKQTPNKTATLTHLGFGLFVLGILLTFSNQKNITSESKIVNTDSKMNETVMLIKNKMIKAGNYILCYDKKEKINNTVSFNVNFYEKSDDDSMKLLFNVKPYIVLNSKMGNVYEPFIRKFIDKDIFSYITYTDIGNLKSDSAYKFKETINAKLNDTIHYSHTFLLFDSLKIEGEAQQESIENLKITARIQIGNQSGGSNYFLYPTYIIKNNKIKHDDAVCQEIGLKIRFKEVSDAKKTIILEIYEEPTDLIVVKIITFPYINLMWVGVFIMFTGFLMSFFKRNPHEQKFTNKNEK